MQTPIRERRYWLTDFDRGVLAAKAHLAETMVQGYLDTPPHTSLRVRVSRTPIGTFATLNRKSGQGVERTSEETLTSRSTAKFLLKSCDLVRKTRYRIDGLKVDVFAEPLDGIVLAEQVVPDLATPVVLPEWIRSAREVTDSLTNQHLARLVSILRDKPLVERGVRDLIAPRLPRIVLTGPAGCGKTTAIEALRQEMGGVVHCVREMATLVMSEIGIDPPVDDPVAMVKFQQTIATAQRTFANVSNVQAIRDGKKVLLLDREWADGAAFVEGGLDELERICRTDRAHEFGLCDLVLLLEVAPRDVYERIKGNNPKRRETWEQSRDQGERLKKVWGGHPNLVIIPNGLNWDEKMATIRNAVSAFVANLTDAA